MSNSRRIHTAPTHRIGRHIAAVPIILIALAACHYLPPFGGIRGGLLGRLGGVDSLINARPDSVLTLLNSIAQDTAEMSRRDLMRYYLLRTNAENKCDTVLTARHAALMRRVCDYYDRHSSPRGGREGAMLAHYLLGRCYDDMGEAPAALEEFHIAINSPDTTDAEIDYGTLYRAYSQLARLFYYHNLFDEQRKAIQGAEKYACLAGDTLMGILFKGKTGESFAAEGRIDTAISISRIVYHTYHQRGELVLAAREAGYMAGLMADARQYETLGDLLREYEQYSACFDKEGMVEAGRELYYSVKGHYCLWQSQTDSARLFFLRGLDKSATYENKLAACKGLRMLYQQASRQDSVVKYALLESSYKDSIRMTEQTDNVQHAQRMYLENRHEQQMALARLELSRQRQDTLLFLSLFISLLIVGIAVGFIINSRVKRLRLQRENQTRILEQKLYGTIMENEQAAEDISQLRRAIQNYGDSVEILNRTIALKQSQLEENALMIESLREQLSSVTKNDRRAVRGETALRRTRIAQLFDDYQRRPTYRPTDEEWGQLRKATAKCMPSFYNVLTGKHQITPDNVDICILLRLGFPSKAIASLKGLQPNTISTRLRSMYSVVFGKDGSSRDFVKYLRSLE